MCVLDGGGGGALVLFVLVVWRALELVKWRFSLWLMGLDGSMLL